MRPISNLLVVLVSVLVFSCSETKDEGGEPAGVAGISGAGGASGAFGAAGSAATGAGGASGQAGGGGTESAGANSGGTSGGGVAGSAGGAEDGGAAGMAGSEAGGSSGGGGGSSGGAQQPFCAMTLNSTCASGTIEQSLFLLKGNVGCDGPRAAFCKYPPGGQSVQDCRVLVQTGQIYVFATSGCPDMADFRICTPAERMTALSSSPADRCAN